MGSVLRHGARRRASSRHQAVGRARLMSLTVVLCLPLFQGRVDHHPAFGCVGLRSAVSQPAAAHSSQQLWSNAAMCTRFRFRHCDVTLLPSRSRSEAGGHVIARSAGQSKRLYPFEEARMMAQSMGFSSKEEWDEYSCPGAYQLPKNADEVYASEFVDWGDWLGIILPFAEARVKTRSLGFKCQEEYVLYATGDEAIPVASSGPVFHSHAAGGKRTGVKPNSRLPALPDLFYKEWKGWQDWLGTSSSRA
ncbi:unnamed protein product [Polarella glacialis]|uniref:Uncharacterized protein n=1 Tax=Polarella glacialis TaxID=89957 RepID=A0A813HPU9_POLGL|nr:unnamed protein product [Polarella glacialis]